MATNLRASRPVYGTGGHPPYLDERGVLDMADPSMPALGASTPMVPPLYQSAVFTLPDLDALDDILDAQRPGFIYLRDGHPNARYLADQLTALEKAAWSVVCGSGMAAITAALLAVAKQGDRVVASNTLYGR